MLRICDLCGKLNRNYCNRQFGLFFFSQLIGSSKSFAKKIDEDWRDENRIPDTDGIEEMRETLKRV